MHPAVVVARRLMDTKYHHQGRLPGVGLDCVGMVIVVAREIGKPTTDDTYGQWPQPGRLLRWFEEENTGVFSRVQTAEPGDVLTFWWTRRDTLWHVGIASPTGIIHVHRSVGKVVEMPLDRRWLKRAGPIFRFKE